MDELKQPFRIWRDAGAGTERGVLRRLRRWTADGHIIRTLEPGGRSVITAMSSTVHRATSANSTAPILATSKSQIAAVNVPVHLAQQGERRLVGPLPARGSRTIFRITASLGFAAIAWFGIRINAWYGVTLGKTDDASSLIAGLSVSADILALFLPAAARTLWVEGYRGGSAAAWALWTMTVAITLMATLGFAALNIADTTAARGKQPKAWACKLVLISYVPSAPRSQRAGLSQQSMPSCSARSLVRRLCGARLLGAAM